MRTGKLVVLIAIALFAGVSLASDEEIDFDLDDLEEKSPAMRKEMLLQILRDSTPPTNETDSIAFEHLYHESSQAQVVCGSLGRKMFRFFEAKKAACYLAQRSLILEKGRKFTSKNRPVEVLLDIFKNQTKKNHERDEWKFPTNMNITRLDIPPIPARVRAVVLKPQIQREIEILKQYDGPAAIALVKQRNALLKSEIERVLFAEINAALQSANTGLLGLFSNVDWTNSTKVAQFKREQSKKKRLRVQKMISLLRSKMASEERPDYMNVLGMLKKYNSSPKTPKDMEKLVRALKVARGNLKKCGMHLRCRRTAMSRLGKLAATLWIGETSEFHDQLIANQSRVIKECSFDCSADLKIFNMFSVLNLQNENAYALTLQTLYGLLCETDECRLEMNKIDNGVTLLASSNTLSARASTNFAEPPVALAGIIVFSVILAALLGVVAVGLSWKLLLARWIWLLLLVGIAAVLAGRLYVWCSAYAPAQFNVDARPDLFSVIAMCVGFFTKLFLFWIMLTLVHFFVQKTPLLIVLIVVGSLAGMATLGLVIYLFVADIQRLYTIEQQMNLISLFAGADTNWIFIPNAMITGVTFLASVALLLFFCLTIRSNPGLFRRKDDTSKAFVRAFAIVIVIVTTLATMAALSVAQIARFELYSQFLFLGIGSIMLEGLVIVALLLFIFNSWWTSKKLAAPKAQTKEGEEPLLSSTESSSSESYDFMRYADYE